MSEHCASLGEVFALPHGQAMSLFPSQDSLLEVIQGRIWVTLDVERIDHVLTTGEHLILPAGAHVVVETWGHAVDDRAQWRVIVVADGASIPALIRT